jgi:uncharacterized membrane protein (DUF4010 family)
MDPSLTAQWPYFPTVSRLGLALALGLFVGLEREWRGKEAGVRTFAFICLVGCLGGLLGDAYALTGLALLSIPLIFLNWQRLTTHQTSELTTSAALMVTGFIGVLCGKGHEFTPVVVAITAAALLAWKERLTDFAVGLSEIELRSAILLAILTFIVYPILPQSTIDPWGLIDARASWMTVILIAGIGFINYIFWKLYGARGITFTGFLGGLVNSTVTATELANRVRESGPSLVGVAYRGIILATAAMLIRNCVLLGLLAPKVLLMAAGPMGAMLIATSLFSLRRVEVENETDSSVAVLNLTSPFTLGAVLKYGLIFLLLGVAGGLAQSFLGSAGFYAVSAGGGLVSSSSAVASAATLASHQKVTALVAANGAVLASVTSVLSSLPLIMRIARQPRLSKELGLAIICILLMGLIGVGIQSYLSASGLLRLNF